MIDNADILYSVTGQSLTLDAPEGRPSSITSVQVFESNEGDDGTAETALGAPAVATNPDTTFAAAAGDDQTDPRAITVASGTGIERDQQLLATNAGGETERIEVASINGTALMARQPLLNTYAIGDTIESTSMAAAFVDAWVQDDDNIAIGLDPNPRWRAVWTYVVASKTYVRAQYFDLVRYVAGHTVTGPDVDASFPGWMQTLPTYHRDDQGQRMIDEAYRQVRIDLYAEGRGDEQARNVELVNHLVIFKSAAIAERTKMIGGRVDPSVSELFERQYATELERLVRINSVLPFDSGGDGSGQDVPAQPFLRR